MSIGGFRQSFNIALVSLFLTYATAHNAQVELGVSMYAPHYPATAEKLRRTTIDPVRLEKFILKTVEPFAPSQADAVDSKVEVKTEPAQSGDGASVSDNVALSLPAQPLLSDYSTQLSLIDKAYLDAYVILKENNSCSRFFGGPRIATSALNSLRPRLKTSLIDEHVGISMFGPTTLVTDFQTGISYRLFQNALVNLRGPFFRSARQQSQKFFNKIGYYPANTREARVTMLLHELGHLLTGKDGRWLLPDDGNNHVQIAANTATIMDRCEEQIKSLPAR
jgi:hypothetical protein